MKPVNAATLSPLSIGVGAEILTEDVVEVLGQLNYTFQKRPRLHISTTTGIDGWSGGLSVGVTQTLFPPSPAFTERLRFKIRVRPEVENIAAGFRCFHIPGNEGEIELVIGAATMTQVFTSADNPDVLSQTLSTAATGTGPLLCVMSLRRTLGGGIANFLRTFFVRDEEVVTLPDPGTD